MSPGVDGAVEMEGDGDGTGLASRGVGGTTMRFGVSIKRVKLRRKGEERKGYLKGADRLEVRLPLSKNAMLTWI